MKTTSLIPIIVSTAIAASHASPIVLWDFNDSTATPSIGSGSITPIGGVTNPSYNSGDGSSDPTQPGLGYQTTTYPDQGQNPGTAGIRVNVSTVGIASSTSALQLSFDLRTSNVSSRWYRLDYTTNNGASWVLGTPARLGLTPNAGDTWHNANTAVIEDPAALDNPDFAFRIVSVFSPVAFTEANSNTNYAANTAYEVARNTTSNYGDGTWRFDMVSVTPITELEWKPGIGGDGSWTVSGGSDWSGGEWQQGASAIFAADPPGFVTLEGAIEAFLVDLKNEYTLDAESGASLFAASGISVDTDVFAILNAPIRNDGQLRKLGGGTLLLGGTGQNHAGITDLAGGSLLPTLDNVVSPNAELIISPGAVFDLDGSTQTIGGLAGEPGGLVDLGEGGTLVIDTPESGSFAYRAELVGDGNVIKRGPGTQRFRTGNKEYTGFTHIEEGVLEVTGNGEMTATSNIDVMPDGELFLVGSSSSGPPQGFGGPVNLMGGRLACENTGSEVLYSADFAVDVQEADSTINVSGSLSTLMMDSSEGGSLQGSETFRKTGAGLLRLIGTHPHSGGIEVRNGSVLLESGATLGAGPLLFTLPGNTRSFVIEAASHTVTKLDGSAPDPSEPEAENTLVLDIANPGAVLTVNQAIELDEDEQEVTTRFQGVIAGSGNLVKDGDGFLALTRWPNTFTGSTTINQGVLAVSQSAGLASTSGVTVNPGGQLRLTSGGEEVVYTFGGDISLAGAGRGGDVTEEAGQGINGALRMEASEDSTVTLTNNIVFDSGDGVTVHVNSATNSLTLSGTLTGGGSDPVSKSGGGTVRIAASNPGLTKPWMIDNGTLEVASGASSGSGSVTVGDGGAVAGLGTVGGALALLDGGALSTALAGSLNVTGAFTAAAGSQVVVTGTPAPGSFTILTASGGISGAGNLGVEGLDDTGFTGTVEAIGNDLVLTLVGGAGITYADWAGGVPPEDDVNGNGYTALMEFALGAPEPGGPFPLPVQGTVVENDVEYLTLIAAVRTNAPTLEVTGETSTDLGSTDPWDSDAVDYVTTGNPGVPADTEERTYRTPKIGPTRTLRLKATDSSL